MEERGAREESRQAALSRWRRGSAIGAVVTAATAGVREAADDGTDDEAVIEEHEAEPGDERAVVVYLVPGVPEASLALVRPWLLPGTADADGPS